MNKRALEYISYALWATSLVLCGWGLYKLAVA